MLVRPLGTSTERSLPRYRRCIRLALAWRCAASTDQYVLVPRVTRLTSVFRLALSAYQYVLVPEGHFAVAGPEPPRAELAAPVRLLARGEHVVVMRRAQSKAVHPGALVSNGPNGPNGLKGLNGINGLNGLNGRVPNLFTHQLRAHRLFGLRLVERSVGGSGG